METKDLHALINELGACLEDEDKIDAMIILNQLYLDGYDDLFICIALIRVLAREDFSRNRFLFGYQPFLDEVNKLKVKFRNIKDVNKDLEICAVYNSSGDVLSAEDRAQIDEYNELFNNSEDREILDSYLDYLYMKYCFSYSEIMNRNLKKYKKIILETNDGGIADF